MIKILKNLWFEFILEIKYRIKKRKTKKKDPFLYK